MPEEIESHNQNGIPVEKKEDFSPPPFEQKTSRKTPDETSGKIPPQAEFEPLKEFLERGEIRTMQKDINRLREMEAQKERERIASLKIKGKEEKEKIITEKKISEAQKEPLATLIPKPPKRPSSFKKTLVRTAFIALLLFFLGFFYWLFAVKKAEVPSEKAGPSFEEETIPLSEKEIPTEPELTIPQSLIEVSSIETLEIKKQEEILYLLPQLLEKTFEDGFFRVLIKNTEKNEILNLEEFFSAFELKAPESFLNKLNNDFTLFIYSDKNVKRLGFLTEIKENEGLTELLNSWEATMEDDTEGLFSTLGKEGPALVPYFKQAVYKGVSFRYISFPPVNFGICWSIFDNYFLWTSSGESIIKTIDKLNE